MASTGNLLLVEDDDVDVQGFKRAFAKNRIGNLVSVARDGIEALDILRGVNGQAKLPRPYRILLNLKMSRMNGLEFPEAIRADDYIKCAIVFMVTMSKAEDDKSRAYGDDVAGYIVKQNPVNTFLDAISLLKHYWKIVEFPE